MAEISDILAAAPLTTDPVTVADKAGLGQDAFLRIFLAQLEHQDPFEPQDSSALGAQLAQFSQLEQSLQMTKQLEGINSRLDQLISSSGASGAPLLDPLAMIGRQVEFAGNSLRVVGSESTEVMRIELERESELLGLVAQSPRGDFIGLSLPDAEGAAVTLIPGTYELHLVADGPRLKTPTGQELTLELTALRQIEDGRFETDSDAAPIQLRQGDIYQFTIAVIDRVGQQFEPRTTTTGTVDGVRIVDGRAVLYIADQDIDSSTVIRIR